MSSATSCYQIFSVPPSCKRYVRTVDTAYDTRRVIFPVRELVSTECPFAASAWAGWAASSSDIIRMYTPQSKAPTVFIISRTRTISSCTLLHFPGAPSWSNIAVTRHPSTLPLLISAEYLDFHRELAGSRACCARFSSPYREAIHILRQQ